MIKKSAKIRETRKNSNRATAVIASRVSFVLAQSFLHTYFQHDIFKNNTGSHAVNSRTE